MNNDESKRGRALAWVVTLVLALSCLGAAAHAGALKMLDSPVDSRALITDVIPEPDGGFSVVFTSGQGQRFDAGGHLTVQFSSRWLATDPFLISAADNAFSAGDRLVLVRPHTIHLPDLEPSFWSGPAPACRTEVLADGRQATVFLPSRLVNSPNLTRKLDGAGGVWMLDQQNEELYRFAADCAQRRAPNLPSDIVSLAPHPDEAAAFYLTGNGQLGLTQPSGVVWERQLPDFDSHPNFVLPNLAALTSGIVLVPYRAGVLDPRLAAFNDSGQHLWSLPLDDDPTAIAAFDQGILIEALNPGSGQYEARLIDDVGTIRWTAPFQIVQTVQPPNPARARFASFIGRVADRWPDSGTKHIVTIELATGEWRLTEINQADRVMATLDNGDLIVGTFPEETSGEQPERLLRIGPDGAPEPLQLAEVLLLEHVLESRTDELGTLVVSGDQSHITMHLLDAQQRPLQSYRLPGSSRMQRHWYQGLALNHSLACVLFERSSWAGGQTSIELHCISRQTAQPAFVPLTLEGELLFLRPDIGDYIEIFRAVPGAEQPLRRIRIGLNGEVLTPHQAFPEPISNLYQVNAIAFPESGHTVFLSSTGVFVLAPDSGPERWTGVINNVGTTVAFPRLNPPTVASDANRLAVLGADNVIAGRLRLVEFDLNEGITRWSRVIPSGDPLSKSLTRSPNSWVVSELGALGNPPGTEDARGLTLRVYDDEEGDLLHIHHRALDDRLQASVRMVGAADQVAVHIGLSGATRIDWIDVFSGELTATATIPISHNHRVVSETLADGSLLVAGRTHGATYPELATSRIDRPSRQRKSDALAGDWAGAWFAPALDGQGFFIDPLDEQDLVAAAWFTFESSATPMERGLRWYTALGAAPAADGISVLILYENRGGMFDQPPMTESVEVGSIRLWETVAGKLVADVRLDEEDQDFAFELTRLTPASSLSGARSWFNPASSGQGLLLSASINDPAPLAFGWFTFDPIDVPSSDTRQHWLVGTAEAPASGNAREAVLYRSQGGLNGLEASSNSQAIGTARLTWVNCNTLMFEYQFDGSDLAAEFAGRSGARSLVSVNSCP